MKSIFCIGCGCVLATSWRPRSCIITMSCTLLSRTSRKRSKKGRKTQSSSACGPTSKQTNRRNPRPREEVAEPRVISEPCRGLVLSELRRAVAAALGLDRNAHRALWTIFRRWSRRSRRLRDEAVHGSHQKKHSERDNQKVDDIVQEHSVAQSRSRRFGCSDRIVMLPVQADELIRKIDVPQQVP